MRWRMLDGELVPINQWWAAQAPRNRSHLPCPAVRADGMSDTVNHADGKTYDSRSAYDAALRASGNHIVEAGEDMTSFRGPDEMEVGGLERDIADAMQKLEAQA